MHGDWASYNRNKEARQRVTVENAEFCSNCGEPLPQVEDRIALDTFDSPYDDKPCISVFCSEECREEYLELGDFSYFYCSECGRLICEQHPNNGWHIQYRVVGCEQVCLQCYCEDKLENGLSAEELEDGIPGLFLDKEDYEQKGWRPVSGFTDVFVNGPRPKERFLEKARDLLDEGFQVMVVYERLAYGGLEGYVTLIHRAAA